ncbi:MAG: hypothetical protein ACJAZ9_002061 [Neolewinella sp.]|jgi:hypothetical protein
MLTSDENKLNEALNHLSRLPRAKPAAGLFAGIEAAVAGAKVVKMVDWRRVAAAAVLVATLNVTAILYYSGQNSSASSSDYEMGLVSDYQLYE